MSCSLVRRVAALSLAVAGALVPTVAPARAAPAPFAAGAAQTDYYNIVNHNSGLALDAPNVNGQRAFQRSLGGGTNQQR